METKTKWRKRLSLYRTVLKGRHVSLPLQLGGYRKFNGASGYDRVKRYFFNNPSILLGVRHMRHQRAGVDGIRG